MQEQQCSTPDLANQGLQEQLHTDLRTGDGQGIKLDLAKFPLKSTFFYLNTHQ